MSDIARQAVSVLTVPRPQTHGLSVGRLGVFMESVPPGRRWKPTDGARDLLRSDGALPWSPRHGTESLCRTQLSTDCAAGVELVTVIELEHEGYNAQLGFFLHATVATRRRGVAWGVA